LARHDGEPVGIHGFIPRMPRAKPPQRKISRAGMSTAGHVVRRRDAPAQAGVMTGRLLSRHDDPSRRPSRTAPGSCRHRSYRSCSQLVVQWTAEGSSNEKPTGDAAVQKSYYIPYAYTFLIHRADRGLIGRKECALKKQHCRTTGIRAQRSHTTVQKSTAVQRTFIGFPSLRRLHNS